MTGPLRLYVSPAWRRKGIHSPLMNPWWGNPHKGESPFAKEVFDTFSYNTACYTVTGDSAASDVVFAPYRHNWLLRHDKALLDECVRVAKEAGLPLLIDGVGDVEFPLTMENAFVLRIGGYRFLPEKGRIQIPSVTDDLLMRCAGGKLQIRKKRHGEKPVVGFAGWASLSPVQTIRTVLKELPVRLRSMFDRRYAAMKKGVLWRIQAIRILRRSPLVSLNLRTRSSFSGSVKTAQDDPYKLRSEMVDIITHSDYCLDVRGDANDSNRLSEILSLGRIPVIVDTERNFPFDDLIKYEDFCLIVDFRDLHRLPERIAEFHKTVSPERFESMQYRAREVFVTYFRIDALMPHIIRELNTLRGRSQ